MKWIKKISILDFVILILVLLGLVGFTVFNSRKNTTIYVSTMNEYLEWRDDPIPPPYWLSNSFNVGDKAYHPGGGEIAEVINVDNTDWGGQRRFSRLQLKVNASYNVRSKLYLLRDEPLLVGNKISLNFGDVHYEGVITYIGQSPEDTEGKHFNAKLEIYSPEIYPWLAETYERDFVVKNTSGDEMFKILSVKIIPAERSVVTDDGRVLRRSDPFFKDAYITALVRVRCDEGVCYYNDTFQLRVGGHIKIGSEKSLIEEKSVIRSFEVLD